MHTDQYTTSTQRTDGDWCEVMDVIKLNKIIWAPDGILARSKFADWCSDHVGPTGCLGTPTLRGHDRGLDCEVASPWTARVTESVIVPLRHF